MIFQIFSFVIKNRAIFLSGFFALALILSATIAHYKGAKNAREKCEKAQREAIIEQVKKEASVWANRPRSDRDAIARLRVEAHRRAKTNP